MADRMKLNIIEVKEKRAVGQAEVVEFIAEDASGKKLKYGAWSKALWEHIKPNATLDVDIETKASEKLNPDTGEPYISRKVVQLYLDGKPIKSEGGQFKGGGYSRQDEDRTDIRTAVMQTAGLWTAGKLTDKDVEVIGLRKWLTHLLCPPVTMTTSAVKSGQGTAQAPKAVAEVKGSDSPFPVDDMLQRICERLKFGSHATARNWVVKTCKIASEQIDADPESTWTAIKELQGWE